MGSGRGSVPETYAGREQAFIKHELLRPYLERHRDRGGTHLDGGKARITRLTRSTGVSISVTTRRMRYTRRPPAIQRSSEKDYHECGAGGRLVLPVPFVRGMTFGLVGAGLRW